MATYEAHCKHCDTYIEYVRRIDDRDDTPVCCDDKTSRVLSAPMIPAMGIADHYQIQASDGRTYYGRHEYEKYLKANDLVPASEIKGEAAYQKAESKKKTRRELRAELEQIARKF